MLPAVGGIATGCLQRDLIIGHFHIEIEFGGIRTVAGPQLATEFFIFG